MTFLAFADKHFKIHPCREAWTNFLPWGFFLLQTVRVDSPIMPPASPHLCTSFLCLLSQALSHLSPVLYQCLLFFPLLRQNPPQHSPSKLTPFPSSPAVPVLLCFSVSVLSDQCFEGNSFTLLDLCFLSPSLIMWREGEACLAAEAKENSIPLAC